MEADIFKLLSKLGCCYRCCLRFTGWRKSNCYDDPLEFATQTGYVTDANCLSDIEPCIACLGILQNGTLNAIVEKVKDKVEKENYDCPTFVCALNIPNSIKLRERSLHVYIAKTLHLSDDDANSLKGKLQNIKDILKWLILLKIEEVTGKHAEAVDSPLLIEISLTYSADKEECQALEKKCEESYSDSSRHKRKYDGRPGKKRVEFSMAYMTDEHFAEYFSVPPLKPTSSIAIGDIVCSHSGVFVGGRYNKFSRKLSQTPWFINGEKKMESSVQDMLCTRIADVFKAKSIKFLSSGREDVDVRNIHWGRPFAVELIDPRVTNATEEDLLKLVMEINESTDQVKIASKLKILSKDDLKKLKEGETVKKKFYRALCICRSTCKETIPLKSLNNLRNVKIIQKTPIRVLHRRPLSPRVRCIYEMRARWVMPNESERLPKIDDGSELFVLDVKTQAGTYVKEFVHGDFGRTKPNLCDLLGCEVDIIALDVTGIDLNWP